LDECLIIDRPPVIDRPPLYDHRLNVKERSKAKKAVLWEEIKNTINNMYVYINLKIYLYTIYSSTYL